MEKKKNTKFIAFRVSEVVHEKVNELAEKEDRSVASYIRLLLEKHLKEKK